MKYRVVFYLILIPLIGIGFVWLFLRASAFFAQPSRLQPTPGVISPTALGGVTPVPDPTLTATIISPVPSPTIRMIVGPFDKEQAPEFALNTLDGQQVKLEDFRGKIVLINFWASWCPPCIEEMPLIQAAYEKHRDKGLVVLGIDMTYKDDRKDVEKFVRDSGATFPILLDESGSVSQEYRVISIPMTFFIDRQGMVRHIQMGAMSAKQLQEYLDDMLK